MAQEKNQAVLHGILPSEFNNQHIAGVLTEAFGGALSDLEISFPGDDRVVFHTTTELFSQEAVNAFFGNFSGSDPTVKVDIESECLSGTFSILCSS